MTLLLPSLQSERIRRSVVDYLTTTFALTDPEARHALTDFLEDEEQGVFVGPFVRLRLPYVPTATRSEDLDWDPGLLPYRHQADAYARLTTKNGHRPQPTIVTTGTGSGKTEAFLHPVLDHVLRARAEGARGVKALILYPMNALATDQAGRLARLIAGDPALAGVTAGLYTGDTASTRTTMGRNQVITDRHVLRQAPPDILLTNYKMLDQLLLRPADREIWATSATSLQYLVLDEFHTYDGAQGTDVAMLLRRLGLTLRSYLDPDDPRQDAFEHSPLGTVCPVATSATLGDGGDPSAMVAFARDVFGRDVPADAVVLETRAGLDEWSRPHREAAGRLGAEPTSLSRLTAADLEALGRLSEQDADTPERLLTDTARALYTDLTAHLTPTDAAHLIQAHPDVLALIGSTEQAAPLTELAEELVGPARGGTHDARAALSTILAALSVIRAGIAGAPDRSAVNVELTQWIREVTRVDRALDTRPSFTWTGTVTIDGTEVPARPALYCRACGRSGWGTVLAATGQGEKPDTSTIRRDRLLGDPRFRTMLDAPGEGADWLRRRAAGETDLERAHPGLRWYSLTGRELLPAPPEVSEQELDGEYLPVLTLAGDEKTVSDGSVHDECPSCHARDSIRFLGSAVATLLSVGLTTLFGDDALDAAEKRALVFTDSVQDAAHRAGFVDQRSHTMSLRSALRGALTAPMPLPDWAATTIAHAQADPFDRYRLVPSELAQHEHFQDYWNEEASPTARGRAEAYVSRRLLFDIELEIGIQSTYGRTLAATGSVTAHVNAGSTSALAATARRVLADGDQGVLDGFDPLTDEALVAWARGVLERMRRDGAIDHEWLTKYKQQDGKRLWIWYKRRRDQGQPAFPTGRSAPAFPEDGGTIDTKKSAFVPVASPRSWYAQWAHKCLHVPAPAGARLTRLLLAALEEERVLSAVRTDSSGTVYGIPADRVVITPIGQDSRKPLLLVCDTCRTALPSSAVTAQELDDAPCTTASCAGHLHAQPHPTESFYRDLYASTHVRRVDASEHTSLLTPRERAQIETGFKRAQQHPGDSNVLVATPTLEMGIDIGDLSTVVLSSLPESVASYVQRVGRAGRRNGSALALAYVPGRRDQLPQLEDPGRLLNGSVRPPSTYLGAEEILRRQFMASVIDGLTRQHHPAVPGGQDGTEDKAGYALGHSGEGSFLAALTEHLRRDSALLVERFARTFADETPALQRLRSWAQDDDAAGPVGLLERAAYAYRTEEAAARHQLKQIEDAIPDLKRTAEMPNATEEEKQALRSAQGASKGALGRLQAHKDEHWVSALERYGILPNYTLIDDTVRLAARVTWRDPDTDEFRSSPEEYDRASDLALGELAPGSTFYTHGLEMRVEGVDVSDLTAEAETWFCCEDCGYVDARAASSSPTSGPAECPRCHSTGIADHGKVRRVLRLTRVFADVSRDDSQITDAADDRRRVRFQIVPMVDFDPGQARAQWSVDDTGLEVTRYRDLHLRWMNTGRHVPGQATAALGGLPLSSRGFRLCEACGKLDTETGASSPREHRPWCEHRSDPAEHVLTIDLMRDLTTEALSVMLPAAFGSDRAGADSLASAVLLGLELTTGGAPDHIGIMRVPHPVHGGAPGETRPALLLHDTVPGGTGYLTDLEDPKELWRLLVLTAQHLDTCECAAEEKTLCHRCLQPYSVSKDVTRKAAVHALSLVLGLPGDAEIGELDPDVPLWRPENRPARAGSGESPLEVRFREELARALGREADVQFVSDATTGIPALTIDGGRWQVLPQRDLGGTRPDFVCQRADGHRSIAIYTDGHEFHASHSHNRLADDARKRAGLRARGYEVISLSASDLDTEWHPDWLDTAAVTAIKNGSVHSASAPAVTDEAVTSWQRGPLGLLMTLLLDESSGESLSRGCGALADSVWGPLGLAAQRTITDRPITFTGTSGPGLKASLHDALAALRPSAALPDVHASEVVTSSYTFRWGRLALTMQLAGSSTVGMALVLDDSDESLSDPGFPEDWRDWLRLSNLLPLSGATVRIATASLADEELKADAAALPGGSPDTASTATATSELGWDALDTELALPEVMRIVPELAAAGVRYSTDGLEVGDGIPTELAWPEERVALVSGLEPEETSALSSSGWTLVSLEPGTDNAAAALINLLGRS